jgi:hypothetical protein
MTDAEAADLRAKLADPMWRLMSGALYRIVDADGRVRRFVPRPEQVRVIHALYREGRRALVLLKARQLGMSTLIAVVIADIMLFEARANCAIVDLTSEDAEKKVEKVRVALDHLPHDVASAAARDLDNLGQIRLMHGSQVYGGKNARGDTHRLLHVSELGPIDARDPGRAAEIRTGAFPSVKGDRSVKIVESTHKGAKGVFADLIEICRENRAAGRNRPDDWHMLFFPWYTDAGYRRRVVGSPRPHVAKYFRDLTQSIGVQFDAEQIAWYDEQERLHGIYMRQEFPSTEEEACSAPVEGAVYAERLGLLRAGGRIGRFAYDERFPVWTLWDIGSPANTCIWFVQILPGEDRFIRSVCGVAETAAQYATSLHGYGYGYAGHILPHDGNAVQKGARSFRALLEEAGLRNVQCNTVTVNVWFGVNDSLSALPQTTFDADGCADGLGALAHYHTRPDSQGGGMSDTLVHDWSSHYADAFRQLAEARRNGIIKPVTATPPAAAGVAGAWRGGLARAAAQGGRMMPGRAGGRVAAMSGLQR